MPELLGTNSGTNTSGELIYLHIDVVLLLETVPEQHPHTTIYGGELVTGSLDPYGSPW